MTDLVLFHAALGRRPAIEVLAEQVRAAGHGVVAPDLYAGRTFDDVDAGVAEADRIGMATLLARAADAVANLPADVVYLGISLGCVPAMQLAGARPGARGIVQVQSAVTPADLDLPGWPDGLALQLHVSPDDPWQDDPDRLTSLVPADLVEVHAYPGTQHLFMDHDLADHDPTATVRFVDALVAWLDAR